MVARIATYRLQLTPSFGFAAAAAVAPDLARLGISHLYLSPVAEAVTGSTHGYDVVDPSRVRDELGGRDALWHLAETARACGLGLLLDLVPNHVSTAEPQRNPWWWALLRDGPGSAAAAYFDVDWEAGDGQVIVPVLSGPVAEEIAAGNLVVEPSVPPTVTPSVPDHDRVLRFHDRAFPLRASSGAAPIDDVLRTQHYRLTPWRDPARNVRRFFTIDDLVAIRPEVTDVRDAVLSTAAVLAAEGLLDGVRLDHIDGLAAPGAFLDALRTLLGDESWILVEKILVGDETLPVAWRVDGTTGYEWINLVDHLFTHPDGEEALHELWRATTGDVTDYETHEREGVRAVLEDGLAPDLARVVRSAEREVSSLVADVDAHDVREAIVAVTVALGRYRTYLPESGEADRQVIRRAADRVAAAGSVDAVALDAVVEVLLAGGETGRRWQQLTGPALAKGAEDRALYRWLPLAAHDEVGGDPAQWTVAPDEFHRRAAEVARHRPFTLLAGSTHDTKRSEDVRARLLVLAEIPARWRTTLRSWRTSAGDELAALDGWTFHLAAQTAVGAWPIDAGRLGDSLVKAAREAELSTSWQRPDEAFEAGLVRAARIFAEGPLTASVTEFVASIDGAGRAIALAQLAIRLTAPGVPDVYQASQTWLHTLVDPDNRRPLDPHALRRDVDRAEQAASVWESVAPKPAMIHRLLHLRRRRDCFAEGATYEGVSACGAHADHVIAFTRSGEEDAVVTVAARFPLSRDDGWQDTVVDLPAGRWRDELSGSSDWHGSVPLADLLGEFTLARPAVVLVRVR